MQSAAQRFAAAVAAAPVRQASAPVVANVTAQPIVTVSDIRKEMVEQLTSPVRWTASVQYMVEHGASSFLEVGPKDVLSGLIKRIAPSAGASSVGDAASLAKFLSGGA